MKNKPLSDYLKGEIRAFCYLVERGKPAATITVQKRYTKTALALIKQDYNLHTYKEELDQAWDVIWIYKHKHILDVIKALPDHPETTFDHWVLGKLFGYDETSIKEFLVNKVI